MKEITTVCRQKQAFVQGELSIILLDKAKFWAGRHWEGAPQEIGKKMMKKMLKFAELYY